MVDVVPRITLNPSDGPKKLDNSIVDGAYLYYCKALIQAKLLLSLAPKISLKSP